MNVQADAVLLIAFYVLLGGTNQAVFSNVAEYNKTRQNELGASEGRS
jgi:hypothetical protein